MIASRARIIAGTFTRSALGLGILCFFMTEADAGNARVNPACANDYFAYCSQHDPDGPGLLMCLAMTRSKPRS